MKNNRYTEEQIAFALKQAKTGTPLAPDPDVGVVHAHRPAVRLAERAQPAPISGA